MAKSLLTVLVFTFIVPVGRNFAVIDYVKTAMIALVVVFVVMAEKFQQEAIYQARNSVITTSDSR